MTSLWSLALVASLASSPQALTTSLFEEAAQIKAPPATGALSKADQASNQKAFAKLDTMIDLNAFAHDHAAPCEAPPQKRISKPSRATLPRPSVSSAFPARATSAGKATIEITGTQKVKGATLVTVFADIPSEELEVELIFREQWQEPRVVDLSIDGSSLVTDYRNQFGLIIAKEGAKSLLEKIQKARDTSPEVWGIVQRRHDHVAPDFAFPSRLSSDSNDA